ncbi:MAG TPA: hypothetical protein PLG78_19970, partial [Leptospiraceae bacterium]|nr:hypothetical protein [Leptospiraceae bacterium]
HCAPGFDVCCDHDDPGQKNKYCKNITSGDLLNLSLPHSCQALDAHQVHIREYGSLRRTLVSR